jgi:tetratricopeptide (TPR) repeat protein
LSELPSVEEAWARLTTHIDWADQFWVAFVFTDDPRVIAALGGRAQAQLEAAGRDFVLLRPTCSEEIDGTFEALLGGRQRAVAWVDLVRHDDPAGESSWRAAWERLMLRLNERRELLRRGWSGGGIVFATTLDRLDETPALAPDLWTVRAMLLRVSSEPTEAEVATVVQAALRFEPAAQAAAARDRELTLLAVERARARGDELGLLELLTAWALAATGDESLALAREALSLASRLLESEDLEGRLRIAASLRGLGKAFASGGARDEAEICLRESIDLAEAAYGTREHPEIARALEDLALVRRHPPESPRLEEALQLVQEAVKIWRALATSQPHVFRDQLAWSLNNLGLYLDLLGRPAEALAVTQESVTIWRELIQTSPGESLLGGLAASLLNLGSHLHRLGRLDAALASTQEAIEHFRKFEHTHPEILDLLALSLNNRASHLEVLGRSEEALTAITEAVEHYRTLAQGRPKTFLPQMATALRNFAVLSSAAGHEEQALTAARESIEIWQTLTRAQPDTFSSELATTQTKLASILESGQRNRPLAAPDSDSREPEC